MNTKLLIGLFGTVIVIGGIVYAVKKFQIDKKNDSNNKIANIPDGGIKETSEAEEMDLNQIKAEGTEKISLRHEEAKKIMNESLNNIYDDKEDVITTKNENAKQKIFNDLDEL